VGKLVGIPAASWLAVRMRLAELPEGVTGAHLVGVGLIGGIGFTMSIFVASLAFAEPAMLDAAKLGVLGGSLVAAVAGSAVLLWAGRRRTEGAGSIAPSERKVG
jgi:NhaA family Na+:H+ antiporter